MSKRRRSRFSTAAHQIINKLFVYGTLLPDQEAYPSIEPFVTSSQRAFMLGQLYAVADEGYPAYIEGMQSRVRGVVFELSDCRSVFALLDTYEGDEFVRVLRSAELPDGTTTYAWCYMLADERVALEADPIPSGSWEKYLEEDDEEEDDEEEEDNADADHEDTASASPSRSGDSQSGLSPRV